MYEMRFTSFPLLFLFLIMAGEASQSFVKKFYMSLYDGRANLQLCLGWGRLFRNVWRRFAGARHWLPKAKSLKVYLIEEGNSVRNKYIFNL